MTPKYDLKLNIYINRPDAQKLKSRLKLDKLQLTPDVPP